MTFEWTKFLLALRPRFERASTMYDTKTLRHAVVRLPDYWDWWDRAERLKKLDPTEGSHECFAMRMYLVMRRPDDASIPGDGGLFRERLIEGERLHVYGSKAAVDVALQLCHEAGQLVPKHAWPAGGPIVPFRSDPAIVLYKPFIVTHIEVWVRTVFATLVAANPDWLDRRYYDDDMRRDDPAYLRSWQGCELQFDLLTASLMTIDQLLERRTAESQSVVAGAEPPVRQTLRLLVRILDRAAEMLATEVARVGGAEGIYFDADMHEAAGLAIAAGYPKPAVVVNGVFITLYDIDGSGVYGFRRDIWDIRPAAEYDQWRTHKLIPHLRRWRTAVNDRLDGQVVLTPVAVETPPLLPHGCDPTDPKVRIVIEFARRFMGCVAKGAFRSQEQLIIHIAKETNCSRSTAWKRLAAARQLGLVPSTFKRPRELTNQMQQVDPKRQPGRRSA